MPKAWTPEKIRKDARNYSLAAEARKLVEQQAAATAREEERRKEECDSDSRSMTMPIGYKHKKPQRRDYGDDEYSYEDDMIRYMNGQPPLGPNVERFPTQEEADAYNRQQGYYNQPPSQQRQPSYGGGGRKSRKGAAIVIIVILIIIIVAIAVPLYDQYTFQKFVDAGCTPIAGNPSGDIWSCPPGVNP